MPIRPIVMPVDISLFISVGIGYIYAQELWSLRTMGGFYQGLGGEQTPHNNFIRD